MIKLVGCIFILMAAGGFGLLYAGSLKEERERLRGFYRLACLIRTRIECFNQPLSEIYCDFSDEALDPIGFTEFMREKGFDQALCLTKGRLGLRDELYSLVLEFGKELGKSYSSDQLRHCERYISLFENKLKELDSELPSRAKLVGVISCAAAVLTVIILV